MARSRSTFSRSVVDRDLHIHLSRATSAVQAAMDLCGRVARNQRHASNGPDFRAKQRRLGQVERALDALGHLDGGREPPDRAREARALCAWLESRERARGIRRHPRRGSEYQDRLRQVLGILQSLDGHKGEEAPQPFDVLKPEVTDG